MADEDFLHAITITWDLDEGTGISVRYGPMSPYLAAQLLHLAAELVREHSEWLLENEEEVEDVELDDSDWEEEDDA
jgi:hypothetical protein